MTEDYILFAWARCCKKRTEQEKEKMEKQNVSYALKFDSHNVVLKTIRQKEQSE